MERAAVIVAGFGYRGAATQASLADAFMRVGGAADALAAPEDKAGGVLADFAVARGLPVIAVVPEAMAAVQTETQSARVSALRGVGSVAEAAALAAAGPGAELVAARVVSGDRMATCALGKGAGA